MPVRPVLSIVVPVYDGAPTIVENTNIIRAAVEGHVDGAIELIVVSDGSLDETEELLLAERRERPVRVIHYDRNLGKGYAVKAGVLAARGKWVSFIDADLDLDPASLPAFLQTARDDDLDIVIGSKRHPDSIVQYPRSRRAASWCYQQLNRVLFRLNVRDTQVGIKLFRSEVADQVFPLLLVKRFAIDLELLAVAQALGFGRVRELPIRLDYRFTGSGVRSAAVMRALIDTAAIFYRLRILRTYQKKRTLLRVGDRRAAMDTLPLVSVIGLDEQGVARLDYPQLDPVFEHDRVLAGRRARGEVVAVTAPGARPAGNWIASAVPFFVRPSIAAVVVPVMPPVNGSLRGRVASAISESRLGSGVRRWRFSPGNIRLVNDFPAGAIVIRRSEYVRAVEAGIEPDRLVAWLHDQGHQVVYTPETVVVAPPLPVFAPLLRRVREHARSRGVVIRSSRGRSFDAVTALSLLPAATLGAGIALSLAQGGAVRIAGISLVALYGTSLLTTAGLASTRFRSVRVGVLTVAGLVATQVTYAGSLLLGVARGR